MNIDKDIEEKIILLKDFIEGNFKRDKIEHYKGSYKMGFFYYSDIKQAIENVLSELETYKKIAEKLADKVNEAYFSCDNEFNAWFEDNVFDYGNKDKRVLTIIDWARKEVENDES